MPLQLRSTISSAGELKLEFAEIETPTPASDEVVIRVEATPINPSDLGLLLGPADMSQASVSGSGADAVLTAPVPAGLQPSAAARFDKSMPVGNEGAGTIVEAGDSAAAQALLGETVAVLGREMYSQFRVVNPLTALGFVETMKLENHTALVQTAAASNLGQMLQKICTADGVDLVNIVRKAEQVELLKGIGAKYVVNSSEPTFMADLVAALTETGATLAFDALGGGRLGSDILAAMEAAAMANASGFNPYGSTVHKQLYIYGGLDTSPTELRRAYGMSWGIGGWLLRAFLERIGAEATERLRQRVADEVTTTFASSYSKTISLEGVLDLDNVAVYNQRATGEKYLVNPNLGA